MGLSSSCPLAVLPSLFHRLTLSSVSYFPFFLISVPSQAELRIRKEKPQTTLLLYCRRYNYYIFFLESSVNRVGKARTSDQITFLEPRLVPTVSSSLKPMLKELIWLKIVCCWCSIPQWPAQEDKGRWSLWCFMLMTFRVYYLHLKFPVK